MTYSLTTQPRRVFSTLGVIALALLPAVSSYGQGCMATRVSPPITGGTGKAGYLVPGQWEVSLTYRSYEAERHFYDANQENVPANAPRVERTIWDLSLTRALTERTSLTVSLPYQTGTFDRSPIPPYTGSADKARGVGDVAVTLRRWMFDPTTHPRGNVRLGAGLKLPTGNYDTQTWRLVNVAAPGSPQRLDWRRGPADVAIQPGDGGLGIALSAEGFHYLGDTNALVYGEVTYLVNPRGANSTNNQWSGAGPYVPDPETSVPDYFIGRAGFSLGQPLGIQGVSLQLGLRIEGQPPRDLIGANSGFRRPGHSLSVEPGVSYAFGSTSIFVSVPMTIHRQRWRSVDEKAAGRTNAVSAAFADYNIMAGVTYRW